MSPVSSSAVAQLRARTGVPILACKNALEEAAGDEEKAIEILRKRGIAQAAKKASRDQAEGLVFLQGGTGAAALVLLRCETDFVARDALFQEVGDALSRTLLDKGTAETEALAAKSVPELVQKLGENISLGEMQRLEAPVLGTYLHSNAKIGVIVGLSEGTVEQARSAAMHAAALAPLYVAPDDVPADLLEKEKDIWREQLATEGKPAAIIDKIMAGKERKFREENALTTQPFVKDPAMTVGKYLGSAKVTAYVRVSVA